MYICISSINSVDVYRCQERDGLHKNFFFLLFYETSLFINLQEFTNSSTIIQYKIKVSKMYQYKIVLIEAHNFYYCFEINVKLFGVFKRNKFIFLWF